MGTAVEINNIMDDLAIIFAPDGNAFLQINEGYTCPDNIPQSFSISYEIDRNVWHKLHPNYLPNIVWNQETDEEKDLEKTYVVKNRTHWKDSEAIIYKLSEDDDADLDWIAQQIVNSIV